MKFKVFRYKKVKSTNNTAIRIIRETNHNFGMIISETQTGGKGQYGRKWSSYKGNIIRSTYEPELSPEEVLSYKLISSFKGNRDTPRIGLRGTAKVYGNRTILFYYLFRKPITFIRQLIGI